MVTADVLVPLVARGVIQRRPRVVGLLDRLDADRRAVRRLQRLRDRYGDGPLLLRLGRRDLVLVLAPEHAERVLADTPEPFTPANREKRGSLSHFQPHGVLISSGSERAERRRLNEDVLAASRPIHPLGPQIAARIGAEAEALLADGTLLDWHRFARSWWRLVRRIVLGDSARDDTTVTDLLARLRRDANWGGLKRPRQELRDRFLHELALWVERAEPGSLAAVLAATPAPPDAFAVEQLPHWLFAFDAAGISSFRALALLAAHPEQAERARTEVAEAPLEAPHELPFLRACVLEAVRLWPTTPAILRDATTPVRLGALTIPAGAAVLIFAPFFHRDETRLDCADRFCPELWVDGAGPGCALVPFSAGPADCPGRNLVLLTSSTLLGRLLAAGAPRQETPVLLRSDRPLPATLSPFRLRLALD